MNLEAMRNIDVQTIDRDTLIDIRNVIVKTDLPTAERIWDFIQQVKNPYIYKCGKVVIKTSYADTEATIEDRLESYLLSL